MDNFQNIIGSIWPSQLHTYSVRLQPGMDIKESVDAIAQQQAIQAGIILTCVGSLTTVALRLANQDQGTYWEGYFEIVSLVGTLSKNGSHVHLSVADTNGHIIGGHVLAGCRIYTTAEIVIGVLADVIYTREPDTITGYQELRIAKKQ